VGQPETVYVDRPTTRTVYVDRPVTQTVVSQPASTNVVVASSGILDTYNITIRTDIDSNTIVAWDNNTQTVGEVVFGLTSQPVDNLQSYSYDFTTGQLPEFNAHHEVNLGKLELNRAYYIRIVSRAGQASDVTSEIVYIPVPGKNIVPTLGEQTTSASAFATIGFFSLRSIIIALLLIIIIGSIVYIITKRKEMAR
jgi:hypothetical protein